MRDHAYHALLVIDVGGEPCWLVRATDPTRRYVEILRRIDTFARWHDDDAGAWRIDHMSLDKDIVDELAYQDCANRTCGVWSIDALDAGGYTVRREDYDRLRRTSGNRRNPADSVRDHAAFLGVAAPYTHDQVQAAFRRKALLVHPDRGGSAQDMRRAIEARDVLLRSLDAPRAPTTTPPTKPSRPARTTKAKKKTPAKRAAKRRKPTRAKRRPRAT